MIPMIFIAVQTILPTLEPHWQTRLYFSKEDALQVSAAHFEGSNSNFSWESKFEYQWMDSFWWNRNWYARISSHWETIHWGFGQILEESNLYILHRSNITLNYKPTREYLFALLLEKPWEDCCISSILTIQWNRGDSYSMQLNFWLLPQRQLLFQQTLPLQGNMALTYAFQWPSKRVSTSFAYQFGKAQYHMGVSQIPNLPKRWFTFLNWQGSKHD